MTVKELLKSDELDKALDMFWERPTIADMAEIVFYGSRNPDHTIRSLEVLEALGDTAD